MMLSSNIVQFLGGQLERCSVSVCGNLQVDKLVEIVCEVLFWMVVWVHFRCTF